MQQLESFWPLTGRALADPHTKSYIFHVESTRLSLSLSCMWAGKNMALTMLHLFVSTILFHYEVLSPQGPANELTTDFSSRPSLVIPPKRHAFVFKRRRKPTMNAKSREWHRYGRCGYRCCCTSVIMRRDQVVHASVYSHFVKFLLWLCFTPHTEFTLPKKRTLARG